MSALRIVEDMLAYRLPQSGKQLGTIVLTRAQAEELVKELNELRQKRDLLEIQIMKWADARTSGSPDGC